MAPPTAAVKKTQATLQAELEEELRQAEETSREATTSSSRSKSSIGASLRGSGRGSAHPPSEHDLPAERGEAWRAGGVASVSCGLRDDSRAHCGGAPGPVSWKGTLVQYTGRLHRLHPGKRDVRIFDYVDRSVPMLLRMFEKRLRGYRAIGYARDEAPLGYAESKEDLIVEYDDDVLRELDHESATDRGDALAGWVP